ncbi:DUF3014 domain-containing protein [Ketobacter sp. MCCC 1A13808]|uniref:DUF3014 domain-containing protein n=1 Tax=Ketobacter sp. MCCC 1A13808 TaxID=2602738 RepID=UPI000F2A5B99|nr:DUF3014 domain-containing protein [Ketobacter sp. MCCC 1A13808]MVF11392.1 DUF3014 domain-containing protein [Ketobacter sp. MCCC 1A13808]RLP54667.1 MAG: DUF3014 domain-containing protein [Ketobacter sp.]
MRPAQFGILVVVVGCIIAGIIWFLQRSESEQLMPPEGAVIEAGSKQPLQQVQRDEPQETLPPPAEEDTTPDAPPPPPIVEAPDSLSDSDEASYKAAENISTTLAQWLTPQEQIRKWVLMVDNVAMGKVPVKNNPVSFPMAPFTVTGNEQNRKLSDLNFKRITPMIDALSVTDPALLARYYRSWQPLLEQAYSELGQPGSFDERFQQAIGRILSVDPKKVSGTALEQPSVFFTYSDKEMENASELDKFLWRMGPVNAERLQSFLKKLQPYLQQQ